VKHSETTSKVISVAEAVTTIASGSNLTMGGFAHSLTPMAMVHEMIRQGKKDIDLTSMGECWAADFLAGAGSLRRARLSNYMFEGYGRCMNFSRGVQEGRIEVEDYSHFGITSRLQATALGVSYLPLKVMAGTDLLNVTTFDEDKYRTVRCPFTDEEYIAVRAIQPDAAIIHASRADASGNTQIFGASSIIEEQARAAKHVIVSVEEIVSSAEIMRKSEFTILPSFLVDAVVEVPFGAHPGGMFRYYNQDDSHIGQYWKASHSPETFQTYLNEFVYGVQDLWGYLKKIGIRQLMALRADPKLGY
jgi:glutaconate CoA-transferase subunit A